MMSIKERERSLFEGWRAKTKNFIEDGVVDEQSFLQQQCRYVFVLKEANQMGTTTLTDFLRDGAPGNGGHTWNPVCRWLTGEASRTFTTAERKEILRDIAVMNLKKEDGGNVTDMRELERVVERDCDLIKAQMEIYIQHEPVVFICCGSGLLTMISRHVFSGVEIDRNATLPFIKPYAGREAYFVGFNHPNARKADLAAKFRSIHSLIKG